MKTIKAIFGDRGLRNRIFFVLFILVITRFLAIVPIPEIDASALSNLLTQNSFFGLLNILSGGGIASFSIVMLGVGPYITSSIIMQLLTIMSPRLKAMYQEDGEIGRKKFTQFSRMITVPLAIVQGLALLVMLRKQGIIVDISTFGMITNLSVVVAGSMLIMWIGELISEFGIGNGVSLIIFAGIVAELPRALVSTFELGRTGALPMAASSGSVSRRRLSSPRAAAPAIRYS